MTVVEPCPDEEATATAILTLRPNEPQDLERSVPSPLSLSSSRSALTPPGAAAAHCFGRLRPSPSPPKAGSGRPATAPPNAIAGWVVVRPGTTDVWTATSAARRHHRFGRCSTRLPRRRFAWRRRRFVCPAAVEGGEKTEATERETCRSRSATGGRGAWVAGGEGSWRPEGDWGK
uniref:Uncharacterized protein n=1 Tax=Oryza meridionalis TaxID=40149 RepID=A0A0E0F267_9ORYZ